MRGWGCRAPKFCAVQGSLQLCKVKSLRNKGHNLQQGGQGLKRIQRGGETPILGGVQRLAERNSDQPDLIPELDLTFNFCMKLFI